MPADPAWLTIECEGERRHARLDLQRTTIGRNEGNVVDLPDKRLSRFHCEIERRGDACFLSDKGSRNGTRLNGKRLEGEVALAPGDVIEIGATRITFGTTRPEGARRGETPWAPFARPLLAPPSPLTPAGPRLDPSIPDLSGRTPDAPFDPRPTLSLAGAGPARAERWTRLVHAIRVLCELRASEHAVVRLAEAALELVPARQVTVLLPPDEARGGPRVAVVRPLPEPGEGAGPRFSSRLVEQVLATGKPALLGDVARDPRFADDVSVMGLALGAALVVPLRALGSVHGVLYVDEPQGLTPDAREEALSYLIALADVAAVALLAANVARPELPALGLAPGSAAPGRPVAALAPARGVEHALRVVAGRGAFAEAAALGGGELAFLLGQTGGAAVEAARLEAASRAALRALARAGTRGDSLLPALVEALGPELEGRALPCALVRIGPGTGELRLAAAGLGPFVHRRAGGTVAATGGTGSPLGTGAAPVEQPIAWGPGDLVLLTVPGSVGLLATTWLPGTLVSSAHEALDRTLVEHSRELGAALALRRVP